MRLPLVSNCPVFSPLKCAVLLLILLAVGVNGVAQTNLNPVRLGFQPPASLTVTGGTTGAVYVLQYAPVLNNSNAWRYVAVLNQTSNKTTLVDTTAPDAAVRFYRATIGMVYIPPGVFAMGSPTNEVGRYSDEGLRTTVTLSRGFWIGRHEVTQLEYMSVVGANPSGNSGEQRPVERVLWTDATNYCALLTARELAAGRIPAGYAYRLPTEAEWEYAARAGGTNRFYYGDDPGYTNLALHAWYNANSFDTEFSVGQQPPNPWGLYDIAGNVSEWCQDWYGSYPGGSVTDPQGPPSGADKVLRGGSFRDIARICRTACRTYSPPSDPYDNYGFRVVLAPTP
jgi:formylglycine-generating enzyme required for sulfatase activity